MVDTPFFFCICFALPVEPDAASIGKFGGPVMGHAMANQGTAPRVAAFVRVQRNNVPGRRSHRTLVKIDQMGVGAGKSIILNSVRVVANRAWRVYRHLG